MKFEWDDNKNATNYKKHKISFEAASEVFKDSFCKCNFDKNVNNEDRYHAIGMIRGVLLTVVVHSLPEDDVIRIISARKAEKTEVKYYEEK